ncbi:MAG: hypothetical protein HC934_02195 [Acaryochloridaceae cyanobacterium SU_2_1]|nr:hypothetical protein [Acaryochloridaceae cyanobacterium SU_2_1]
MTPLRAEAFSCLALQGHQICVTTLNRSAKNYWEYRVTLEIDGVQQAQEVYNCRDHLRIQADGKIRDFSDQDPHLLVCRLYKP